MFNHINMNIMIFVAGTLSLCWRQRHQANMAIEISFGIYMSFHEGRGPCLFWLPLYPQNLEECKHWTSIVQVIMIIQLSFMLNQYYHTVIFACIWIPIVLAERETAGQRKEICWFLWWLNSSWQIILLYMLPFAHLFSAS